MVFFAALIASTLSVLFSDLNASSSKDDAPMYRKAYRFHIMNTGLNIAALPKGETSLTQGRR